MDQRDQLVPLDLKDQLENQDQLALRDQWVRLDPVVMKGNKDQLDLPVLVDKLETRVFQDFRD